MSSAVTITIAIGAILLLAAVVMLTAARRTDVRGAGALSRETRRRDKDADIDLPVAPTGRDVERSAAAARAGTDLVMAAPVAPVVWVAPDREAVGVSRRQFLNRASVSLMGASITAFSAASFVGFLWPSAVSGFGGKISIGNIDDVISTIETNDGFFYSSSARSWITQFPTDALPKAQGIATYAPVLEGMRAGVVALYQKCPHLGCRVPSCASSQWFECPCHGSQYNRVGEKKAGPAPRGMDRFAVSVSASGEVVIDTAVPYPGPPIGTNTTGQEAEGPHCTSGEH